jgi:hypothetical protein
MKTLQIIIGIVAIGVVLILLSIMGFVCNHLENAGKSASKVIEKEFYPEALLKKYEWFKNTSAVLAKKQADIQIYSSKIQSMKEDYSDTKRKDWDRTDKETFNQWEQELAGIKASYNSLAAEYNSQMSKFNWKFTNIGECPPGSETLPRNFASYEDK